MFVAGTCACHREVGLFHTALTRGVTAQVALAPNAERETINRLTADLEAMYPTFAKAGSREQ